MSEIITPINETTGKNKKKDVKVEKRPYVTLRQTIKKVLEKLQRCGFYDGMDGL